MLCTNGLHYQALTMLQCSTKLTLLVASSAISLITDPENMIVFYHKTEILSF